MDRETSVRFREIIALLPKPDPLLGRVARLGGIEGSSRVQTGVVVCAGGAMFRGVVAPTSAMATILDEHMGWFFKVVQAMILQDGNGDPSLWDELVQKAERGEFYSEDIRKDEQDREEFYEEVERRNLDVEDLVDLPDDLIEAGISAYMPRSTMTLESAEFRGFGDSNWEEAGVVRIRLSEVSAWWPFKLGVPTEVVHLLSEADAS